MTPQTRKLGDSSAAGLPHWRAMLGVFEAGWAVWFRAWFLSFTHRHCAPLSQYPSVMCFAAVTECHGCGCICCFSPLRLILLSFQFSVCPFIPYWQCPHVGCPSDTVGLSLLVSSPLSQPHVSGARCSVSCPGPRTGLFHALAPSVRSGGRPWGSLSLFLSVPEDRAGTWAVCVCARACMYSDGGEERAGDKWGRALHLRLR